ncbi:non-specific lipid-transfer protein-like [Patiria miniata]|uniref:Sterol carrier protein 2 n=1 Tax=Patiria miniata TaxID=46514 RepID=A0A913ZYD5_PATMI|nr:non-specific lipid-transfer protein-like [Patiria miniata]
MSGKRRVFVVGVGMTKFEKPGRRADFDYPDMAKEAGTKALQDAGIKYSDVEQGVVGYVYGDTTCGQRAMYQLGMTGIPIYNVNNACATGSSALFLAKQLVEGGMAECVMALGFEKMQRGSLKAQFEDRTNPMDKHVEVLLNNHDLQPAPIAAQMFGQAGKEHMHKYGTTAEQIAKIAYKNHKHSTNNPYSQFQTEYSLDDIQKSPMVSEPLTKLQCCPTSDGGAAAVLCSEDFVRKHKLQGQAVEIIGMQMATDLPSTFEENSVMKMVGYDMTKKAADELFNKTGIRPTDVHVVELHDCFAANELITYEALGLCPPGKAGELIDEGDNTYGGKYVINPSGGLISKGHPLGATGLAQCSELCWQLRGEADRRQVPGAKLALQHNIGLGGAVVVTLYKMGFPDHPRTRIQPRLTAAETFQCEQLFNLIADHLKEAGGDLVEKTKASFGFKVIDGPGGKTGFWVVDLKTGTGSVKRDVQEKVDVTFTIKDADLVQLMMGKLQPQSAFFSGKLKVAGQMRFATKLQAILPKDMAVKAKL